MPPSSCSLSVTTLRCGQRVRSHWATREGAGNSSRDETCYFTCNHRFLLPIFNAFTTAVTACTSTTRTTHTRDSLGTVGHQGPALSLTRAENKRLALQDGEAPTWWNLEAGTMGAPKSTEAPCEACRTGQVNIQHAACKVGEEAQGASAVLSWLRQLWAHSSGCAAKRTPTPVPCGVDECWVSDDYSQSPQQLPHWSRAQHVCERAW